jgi:hypothetical protein
MFSAIAVGGAKIYGFAVEKWLASVMHHRHNGCTFALNSLISLGVFGRTACRRSPVRQSSPDESFGNLVVSLDQHRGLRRA